MHHHAVAYRLRDHARRGSRSPDDLLHDMQVTLAAVADIEYRYERDCERIERSAEPEAAKTHLLAECESRRCREREPYLRELEDLQHRLRAHLTSGL